MFEVLFGGDQSDQTLEFVKKELAIGDRPLLLTIGTGSPAPNRYRQRIFSSPIKKSLAHDVDQETMGLLAFCSSTSSSPTIWNQEFAAQIRTGWCHPLHPAK